VNRILVRAATVSTCIAALIVGAGAQSPRPADSPRAPGSSDAPQGQAPGIPFLTRLLAETLCRRRHRAHRAWRREQPLGLATAPASGRAVPTRGGGWARCYTEKKGPIGGPCLGSIGFSAIDDDLAMHTTIVIPTAMPSPIVITPDHYGSIPIFAVSACKSAIMVSLTNSDIDTLSECGDRNA
jgi:hypothetical protein